MPKLGVSTGPAANPEEERLVREHLPLVHYAVAEIATKIPRHVSRDDLISAGMAGLAQAARNYDESRGITFDRYASTRIRGSLLDELRNCDWASRSVRARARQMQAASDELTAKYGRAPTTTEVAQKLGVEESSIESLADDVHRAVVLNYDSMITDGGGSEDLLPADREAPDDVLVDRERKSYLYDAVDTLPERLRRVVIGYFFEERPMQELADELGVSESRISQMRAEALALIKDGMNSHLDPENLVEEQRPTRRVAKRKAAYYAAIASNSDYKSRLDADSRRGRFSESSDERPSSTSTVA